MVDESLHPGVTFLVSHARPQDRWVTNPAAAAADRGKLTA
jgi:hypothetical protein